MGGGWRWREGSRGGREGGGEGGRDDEKGRVEKMGEGKNRKNVTVAAEVGSGSVG